MRRDVLWSIWKIGRYPIKVSEVLHPQVITWPFNMVYDMSIYLKFSQEDKMMPKITIFPRYVVTLKKHQFSQGYFKYL